MIEIDFEEPAEPETFAFPVDSLAHIAERGRRHGLGVASQVAAVWND